MTQRPLSRPLVQAALAAALAVTGVGALSAVSPDRAARAQASRDAGAEAFVQAQAQRVVALLGDKSSAGGDKVRQFRAIVDQIADVPKITTFVLGKYARTISPGQRQKFDVVYKEYAENVYEKRLGDFHGDSVKVTGSVVRKPGDVVVNTVITGGKLTQPVQAGWRVMGSGANWKVVDVQVSGIWLAITQQQDFVSTIDNNGGNIDVLISQLQQQTQQQNAARG